VAAESRFVKRTALVTGAASGIGAATARLLAAEGATVYCADRDADRCDAIARLISADGGSSFAVTLDVTNERAWEAVIGRIASASKPLSVLVNSAGVSHASPLFLWILDVHPRRRGTIHLSREEEWLFRSRHPNHNPTRSGSCRCTRRQSCGPKRRPPRAHASPRRQSSLSTTSGR